MSNLEKIKQLRQSTGAGFKDCGTAIQEANGDLDKAAESQDYCDELLGTVKSFGLEITELSTHLQGQLVAVHPAYDLMFDNFAPDKVKNNPKAITL